MTMLMGLLLMCTLPLPQHWASVPLAPGNPIVHQVQVFARVEKDRPTPGVEDLQLVPGQLGQEPFVSFRVATPGSAVATLFAAGQGGPEAALCAIPLDHGTRTYSVRLPGALLPTGQTTLRVAVQGPGIDEGFRADVAAPPAVWVEIGKDGQVSILTNHKTAVDATFAPEDGEAWRASVQAEPGVLVRCGTVPLGGGRISIVAIAGQAEGRREVVR